MKEWNLVIVILYEEKGMRISIAWNRGLLKL